MEFDGLAESPCVLWLHLIMPGKRDQWVQPRYTRQNAGEKMPDNPDIPAFFKMNCFQFFLVGSNLSSIGRVEAFWQGHQLGSSSIKLAILNQEYEK